MTLKIGDENHFYFIDSYNIVQAGCGGNGSLIALFLSRLLAGLNIRHSYTLVDADTVEEKNLIRQHFSPSDLGKNKAQVLAERYSKHFGLSINYSDEYITDVNYLEMLFDANAFHGIPILIGAVDNNAARRLFDEFFNVSINVIYIDCGCEEEYGQAVLGMKIHDNIHLPPISHYYPDILSDDTPAEVGCGEAPIQDISANILSATAVFNFLNNIIAYRKIPTKKVTYDSHLMVMHSDYIETQTN